MRGCRDTSGATRVLRRPRCSGSCSPNSSSSRWSAAGCSTTTSAHSRRSAKSWPGTRTTCGCGCSRASGSGSARRRRSSAARRRSATSSARRCSRLGSTRDLMRLCFLIERRYAPYSKWFGTAFSQLDAAAEVGPLLEAGELGVAYEAVARRHNALGVTDPLEPTLRPYYGRPFPVIFAERFAAACMERVEDPWLRSLPPIGAIDQWCDSTDVLSKPAVLRHAVEPRSVTERNPARWIGVVSRGRGRSSSGCGARGGAPSTGSRAPRPRASSPTSARRARSPIRRRGCGASARAPRG